MNERRLARPMAYGVAVLAVLGSLLVRLPLVPWLGDHAELMTFLPAIIFSAYLGGLGHVLGAAVGDYFFIEPRYSFGIERRLGLRDGAVPAGGHQRPDGIPAPLPAASRPASRYAITLASIGDAIIATDARRCLLNPVAEAHGLAACGRRRPPLAEVSSMSRRGTRRGSRGQGLRLGTVVGLANHTALIARDGREVPIDDCGAPIIDDAPEGVVLVFRDVTQRRQAEEAEAIRRANERMELALCGSNVGVWEHETPDADYRHRQRYYVNVWEQLGYEGPPAGGETLLDAIHPDDRDRAEEAVRRYLAGESAEYETEVRFRHRDGSYRTLLVRGVAVRDAAGKPTRLVGVTVDMTQLRNAEEELRRTTQLFQAVADGTQDAVYVKDREGRHLMFNAAASRMVGKPIGEVLGRDDTAIFDPDGARW